MSDTTQSFDVIVIGGGVNGTGVARDCALRGLRVALFEKNDFAFGASGNNSGMIHGGPRYLTDHPEVTESSCRDSGYIQQIAPNLLFRIPFLVPVKGKGAPAHAMLAAYDAFFTWYDEFQPLKGGKPHTLLDADEVAKLEPDLAGMFGAVTFDEWGIDGHRLCTLNVVDAEERGASIFNGWEVEALLRTSDHDGDVEGVRARDVLTGEVIDARADVVINATGAWSPVVAKLAKGTDLKLRPGKGIHVVYDRRLSNYAVVAEAIDGREIFLMPWENISWIGTTDDDFYGNLDTIQPTTDEVRYLVQGVASVLPSVLKARIIGTTVGVRPTMHEWGKYESKLSREHEIVNHDKDGAKNLYSMIGGKLASYRIFAEEMSNIIADHFSGHRPCLSHESPLPGGDAIADSTELSREYDVPEHAIRRLVYRHGSRAERLLERTKSDRNEARVVCPCEPVLECEIRHACQHEHVRKLSDLSRRCRLGLGPCGGMECAHRAAQIVSDELWDGDPQKAREEATEFLEERYASRAVAMDGVQTRQEALLAGAQVALRGTR